MEGKLEFAGGADLLKRYKVPDAERFSNVFCTHCGAPMPREIAGTQRVVIPAGSLLTSPGIKPQARIFWDSRTDWSCSEAALPAFAEYPTE